MTSPRRSRSGSCRLRPRLRPRRPVTRRRKRTETEMGQKHPWRRPWVFGLASFPFSHTPIAPIAFAIVLGWSGTETAYSAAAAVLRWIPGFKFIPNFLDRFPILRKLVKVSGAIFLAIHLAPALAGGAFTLGALSFS